MSTESGKAAKHAMRDGGVTLVVECYREVTSLSRASLDPTSDRRMNRLQEALYEATAVLAAAPSIDIADVQAKLAILCARLREHLLPEHRGELLTYLLAESVREDLRLLVDDKPR